MRDAGRQVHPQPRVQKGVARPHTSIHSGGTGKPGHPAHDGGAAYAVLSSGRCSIAPVLPRKMVCRARLGRRTSAGITPASGAGPHGLPARSKRRSSCATLHQLTGPFWMGPPCQNRGHARHSRVHRIPFRVRDDRDTPLGWDETAILMRCFEQKGNGNIFGSGAGQPRNTLGTQTSNAEFITF